MAREPNKKAEEAYELYKKGMKLVDIATKLDVPAGTVRRWKSTYRWEGPRGQEKKQSERSGKGKASVRNACAQKERAVADEVMEVMENTDLTEKQRFFCIYYVQRFNATKAYQKAYGASYESAAVNGSRMLRNDKVRKEIGRLKKERLNRELFDEEDIFQKYMDIAFADITDYAEFGQKKINAINSDTGEKEEVVFSYVNIKDSSGIDGTLVSEVSKGKDGVKVKLSDRMKALSWLSEHMDMATEKQRAEIELLKSKARTEEGGSSKEDVKEAVKFYMPDNGRDIKRDGS